jgi:hypothetical protein
LAYCVPLALPHSKFRSWDQDDQDKALAFLRVQRETCQNCGTRMEEWDGKRGGDRFAYVAESERCPGCELIAQEHENIHNAAGESGGTTKGVRVFLLPNTGPRDEDA